MFIPRWTWIKKKPQIHKGSEPSAVAENRVVQGEPFLPSVTGSIGGRGKIAWFRQTHFVTVRQERRQDQPPL
jgi:hypothetical protein